MHTFFTIVFWLQVQPPPGFQPLPIKQEPTNVDPPGATPTSEPAVAEGTQGGVTPGSSHPIQEEPDHPGDKTATPAPGVSDFSCCMPLLPCTIQCKHCEHPTHF